MRGISGAARDPHGLLSGNPESQDMCLEAILFLFLLLNFVPMDALSGNETGCSSPTISVILEKGKPRYSSHPYSELVSLCHHGSVLGCTVSEYACSHKIRLNEED